MFFIIFCLHYVYVLEAANTKTNVVLVCANTLLILKSLGEVGAPVQQGAEVRHMLLRLPRESHDGSSAEFSFWRRVFKVGNISNMCVQRDISIFGRVLKLKH